MKIEFHVGIIGAGFAGLVAALRLKKIGRESFVIFERASEVGGTWRDNIYPGCACDVASPLYSYAGEDNPEWSRLYSEQPEILAYINYYFSFPMVHFLLLFPWVVTGGFMFRLPLPLTATDSSSKVVAP